MAEPQSQSQRMRTRSQGFKAAGNGGGMSDSSGPGGGGTEQPQLENGERSSVMAPTPSQTQSELSATVPDIAEPFTTASDPNLNRQDDVRYSPERDDKDGRKTHGVCQMSKPGKRQRCSLTELTS